MSESLSNARFAVSNILAILSLGLSLPSAVSIAFLSENFNSFGPTTSPLGSLCERKEFAESC